MNNKPRSFIQTHIPIYPKMMKKYHLYIYLVFWALISVLLAQPVLGQVTRTIDNQQPGLQEPRGVKEAYAAGTRSRDGKPGPNYWENHGRYKITITARPPDRTIRGTEQIVYRNESPKPLPLLIIKLFMNIHQPGAPRGSGVPSAYLTSGIHIDSIAVNGQVRPWRQILPTFTWQPVRLMKPLAPHDSVELAFQWHYRLAPANRFGRGLREGVIDSTTFFLAYFYPRIAVYDDYQGWDVTSFDLGHEFYSDFNDYDVKVNVPSGFIVWGTGNLQNPDELLQSGPLSRYHVSFTSDTTIHIASKEQMIAGNITKENSMNSWHFTAHNIPDVAFGLSNHYDWDAASVVVDDASGRRASVQAAYNDNVTDFHHMTSYVRHALDWFSHQWPGVSYPYSKMTAFQGGAEQEYPMMINDASNKNLSRTQIVSDHEISHTYMPFYMGIDETRYGFMDEGWAVTFEHLIGSSEFGKMSEAARFEKERVSRWTRGGVAFPGQWPSPDVNIPITTPGDALSGGGFGSMGLDLNEYGKAALGYLAVKDLLGDAIFKKCLQAYMTRWHGRHPNPWDFFYTFDDVSGQNLNWFWRNWFFSRYYIDLAVSKVTKTGNGYTITLDNIGGMDAPVNLVLHFSAGDTKNVHETPAIWQANQKHATVNIKTDRNLTSLTLDGGIWEDADTSNNSWKVN